MPALERMLLTRIVAAPDAIDSATWPADALALRIASDEVLVGTTVDAVSVSDPHAIIERETAFFGVWVDHAPAMAFLERECDWELPVERPVFAQGSVAGLPLKVWLTAERILFVVPAPFAADFEARWS